MKLIEESKTMALLSKEYPFPGYCSPLEEIETVNKRIYFLNGMQAAETELQNLAIEFAEFSGNEYDYRQKSKTWIHILELGDVGITTTELFTKFITERNK